MLITGFTTGFVNVKYGITSAKPESVWVALKKGDLKKAAESLWDMVRPRPQTWADLKKEFDTPPQSATGSDLATAQSPIRNAVPNYGKNGTALPEMEKKMVQLVNQERKKAGLQTLEVDPRLTELARKKSADMAVNGYFNHKSPTYGWVWDMLDKAGIAYQLCGENIAGDQTVDEAHEALMESKGHRENILRPEFTHIGIGIVASDKYGLLVTQIFMTPQ